MYYTHDKPTYSAPRMKKKRKRTQGKYMACSKEV